MKKMLSIVLSIILIFSCASVVAVYADVGIKVVIDGKEQTYDVMPVIVKGRTLVPLRGIFETLGANIVYTDGTKRVTATKGDTVVKLKIGNEEAYINQTPVTLDVEAQIISDRTMVPVRFVSEALGADVKWISDTKTVDITSSELKPGLAKLVSEVHRPVPTAFEKSSKIDDVLYFSKEGSSQKRDFPAPDSSKGEVVFGDEEFFGETSFKGAQYATMKVIEENNEKIMQFKTKKVAKSSSDCILSFVSKIKGEVKKDDVMLLSFKVRCVEGGSADNVGIMQLQIQEKESGKYQKSTFEKVICPHEWKEIFIPLTGVDNANEVGIRPAFNMQTIEIKDFVIVKYNDIKAEELPFSAYDIYDLGFMGEDAEWRKEAFKRIEDIRRGDFSVIVKDKEGNVIPDADVEFDMFEHQFQIGSSVRTSYYNNETAAKLFSENFNSGVSEGAMKWATYMGEERYRIEADDLITRGTEDLKIKYFRGHALIWEVAGKTSAGNVMVPLDVQESAKAGDKEAVMKAAEQWMRDIMPKFKDKLTDWDVTNESILNTAFTKYLGNEIYKDFYTLARDIDPSVNLYYNENAAFKNQREFFDNLDLFNSLGIDYDGVGIQTHRDGKDFLYDTREVIEFYNKIRTEYGKRIKVTEYSCNMEDKNMQANYLRDMIIAAYAEENMDGFLFWGYWDGSNFKPHSPFYDKEFNLKPAGKVFQDLFYNKWWTKDAKAKTDSEGKASVKGYYGDYDVTVTYNGKTKTVSCAYHKGYENILEITLD